MYVPEMSKYYFSENLRFLIINDALHGSVEIDGETIEFPIFHGETIENLFERCQTLIKSSTMNQVVRRGLGLIVKNFVTGEESLHFITPVDAKGDYFRLISAETWDFSFSGAISIYGDSTIRDVAMKISAIGEKNHKVVCVLNPEIEMEGTPREYASIKWTQVPV